MSSEILIMSNNSNRRIGNQHDVTTDSENDLYYYHKGMNQNLLCLPEIDKEWHLIDLCVEEKPKMLNVGCCGCSRSCFDI